jgi:hypothetical protein
MFEIAAVTVRFSPNNGHWAVEGVRHPSRPRKRSCDSMTDSSSCARFNPARPRLGLPLRSFSVRRSAAATRSHARSKSTTVYCRGSGRVRFFRGPLAVLRTRIAASMPVVNTPTASRNCINRSIITPVSLDGASVSLIVMPSTGVIPAMPVEGIIDPACVRTIRRSPKRSAPDCADNSADHSAGRSSDNKPGPGSERCANSICLRTRWSSNNQENWCSCQ